MKIINLNTPEIPCPGSHHHTSTKFCKSFTYLGYEFIELNTLENIEQYNSDENIVLLSNHFVSIKNENYVYEIGKKLPNCVFIAWHFNHEKHLRDNMPFQKYIITGEYNRATPTWSPGHIDAYNFSQSCPNWIPFEFLSSLNPSDVGTLERFPIFDSCYIGAAYKVNWITRLYNCRYFISGLSSDFLPEEERVKIYLSSRVCLGFHSDGNIANSCITERVFEGLAFGCAVVSDNPAVVEATNGIVKYVSSFDELIQQLEFFRDDTNFYKHQELGYEFIRAQGTYYHLASKFISKIKEIYN